MDLKADLFRKDIVDFLKEVQKYPCLYDNTLPEYPNKVHNRIAWTAIAKRTNTSVYDCRDRWRKIRVSSMRSLKQQQTDKPPIRPYYLSEELNFLTPFIKINSKEESTNIQEINIHNEVQFEVASVNTVKYEMSETDSSDCFETENDETEEIDRNIFNNHTLPRIVNIQSVEEDIPKNSIKRHNDDLIENNPRKMFLLGILPDVESLTEHEMRRFRTEVIEVIDKIMNERDNSKN